MLERVLSSSERAFALGEFHCLWRLPEKEITCSCGRNLSEDEMWAAIVKRSGLSPADFAELGRLEASVVRSSYIARAGYSLERLRADSRVRRFLDLNFALLEAAGAVSGKPILIDSSKAGPRAWMLACDARTRFVHLYREPAAVIASWRSRKFDAGLGREMQRLSVRHAAFDWWKVEYLIRKLARVKPVTIVNYQDLCQVPQREIDRIWRAAAMPERARVKWLGDRMVAPGDMYHTLNGNPDRFDTGPIRIAPRIVDWSRHSPIERIAIQVTGGTLGTFYRPRRHGRTA